MHEVSGRGPVAGAADNEDAIPPRPNDPIWIIVRRDSNDRSDCNECMRCSLTAESSPNQSIFIVETIAWSNTGVNAGGLDQF